MLESREKVLRELHIKREIPVYYCEAVVSPVLAGVIKPRVLLPGSGYAPSELYYVFRHELLHFKRGDGIYKWLIELAVCLHWFNPLVYVMRRACENACELSCDQAVLAGLGTEERKAYGDTLISTLKTFGAARAPICLPLCENAGILKERLESIMGAKKVSPIQRAAALGVTVLLAGGLFFLGGTAVRAETEGKQAETDEVTDPWLNDSQNSESKKWRHNFKVESFFYNRYGLELAWNNDPALYDTTRQISADVPVTVAFTEETEKYADNAQVLEAIRLSILQQREWEKGISDDNSWKFPIKNPVLVSLVGPYEETYDQLSERFYNENNFRYFFAVLKQASPETRNALMERAYKENNITCFTVGIGSLTAEEQEEYLQKSYHNNQITFFSVLAAEVSEEVLAPFVERTYQENDVSFFSCGVGEISEAEQKNYAYRAYEDDRIDFFSVVVDYLSEAERQKLAKKARQDGKTAFCYIFE